LIIGAFAVDGPLKCSGLEACWYDAERLMQELGEGFKLIDELTQTHSTPTGKPQKFLFTSFQRVE
jgi:hypothetical protein